MKTDIFIPDNVIAGFRERKDTYSGKLAYIIYKDEKGKLRKEKSWKGWIDKSIETIEFKNEPFDGFVLNKKVGDYESGWNHRKSYCRVYDSRYNFEFEISFENLLYILEHCNSIKGKGLEGEFVYSWSGKDLILLPIQSKDYEEIKKMNDIIKNDEFIKNKDLKVGCKYLTRQGSEYTYMGRYKYYDYDGVDKGMYYWLSYGSGFEHYKSLNKKIVECLNDEINPKFSELFENLENNMHYSPIDKENYKYLKYSFKELEEEFRTYGHRYFYIDEEKYKVSIYHYNDYVKISYNDRYTNDNYWRRSNLEIKYKDLEELFKNHEIFAREEYLKNGNYYTGGKLK